MGGDPEFLYRYRPLSDLNAEYAKQIILDDQIYFTSPANFNDPFDCRVRFSASATPVQWRQFLDSLLKHTKPGMRSFQRQEKIRSITITGKYKDPAWLANIARDLQVAVDNSAMLCLSEDPVHLLMWSHYASAHQGFCLKLRARPNDFFGVGQPVNYSDTYPEIAVIADVIEQIRAFIFTKASCWSYEREWRLVIPDAKPGLQSFAPQSLVGIILGARMPSVDRDQMVALCGKRRVPLELAEAVIDEGSFSLRQRQEITFTVCGDG
jgi:Protein of unknown function (DUF2971)